MARVQRRISPIDAKEVDTELELIIQALHELVILHQLDECHTMARVSRSW